MRGNQRTVRQKGPERDGRLVRMTSGACGFLCTPHRDEPALPCDRQGSKSKMNRSGVKNPDNRYVRWLDPSRVFGLVCRTRSPSGEFFTTPSTVLGYVCTTSTLELPMYDGTSDSEDTAAPRVTRVVLRNTKNQGRRFRTLEPV